MGKNVFLSLKKAKALVKRELGSCKGLKAEKCGEGVYIYEMTLGRFRVVAENDWFEKDGKIVLRIISGTGPSMCFSFDPNTLEPVEV